MDSLLTARGSAKGLHGGLDAPTAFRPTTTSGEQEPDAIEPVVGTPLTGGPCLQHLAVGCHDGQSGSIALSVATRPSASFWSMVRPGQGMWTVAMAC